MGNKIILENLEGVRFNKRITMGDDYSWICKSINPALKNGFSSENIVYNWIETVYYRTDECLYDEESNSLLTIYRQRDLPRRCP